VNAVKIVFKEGWKIERPETELDAFAKRFIKCLGQARVNYVIVSGYVSILFGRSRNSEDIDLFIEADEEKFVELWRAASPYFECINALEQEAFNDYLNNGIALRFAERNKAIPNMEVKLAKTDLDEWSLKNAEVIQFNGTPIRVSPLELQIAFKLFLGSDKDFEDARHLWLVTKSHLNKMRLQGFFARLNVFKEANEWLK